MVDRPLGDLVGRTKFEDGILGLNGIVMSGRCRERVNPTFNLHQAEVERLGV
jgi:hypothetical protein